jgi:nitroreductase
MRATGAYIRAVAFAIVPLGEREEVVIVELLKSRFSVRRFQDRLVPGAVLEDILEAGRLSPSGGNEQPWAFGVIDDRALIGQVAEIAYRQQWIARAPLLIVLCTIGVPDSGGGRDIQKVRFPEYAEVIAEMDQALYWALNQEEHQTKIVGTHMAMAALEHGIGSCWVSRFDVDRLRDLLNLPTRHLPSEILVFGYPELEREPRPKKGLDEILFYNIFA